MEAVAKLDDEQIDGDKNAARLILGVALEHDREHRKQIQAWRRRRAKQVLHQDGSSDPPQDQAVDPPRLDTR